MHGAGIIERITHERLGSRVSSYYVFRMPAGGLVLKIPIDACCQIGLRCLSTAEHICQVLSAIPTLEVQMSSNWNQRYRDNLARLKSGDLLEVAWVIKGLMWRDHRRGLSNGERKMLHSADPHLRGGAGGGNGRLPRCGAADQRSHDAGSVTMGKLFDKIRRVQDKTRPFCSAIVPAAGSSARMGGQDKLLTDLCGAPVLMRTLCAIDRTELVDEIIVATREELLLTVADLCGRCGLHKPVKVVRGGSTRAQSVLAAALEANPKAGLLAVHDAARPLVDPAEFDEIIRFACRTNAAAPAVPVTDTIKTADPTDGRVLSTPDRSTLFAVQTPQVMEASLLKAALQSAIDAGVELTDDCSAVERLGKEVYLATGSRENIKITTPLDLLIAEAILRGRDQ